MGYGVIMMFPNTNHLLPVTMSPIPSAGDTGTCLQCCCPCHASSSPQLTTAPQQPPATAMVSLGQPGAGYRCLIPGMSIIYTFNTENIDWPTNAQVIGLPRLCLWYIEDITLIDGNKFLMQTKHICLRLFNARKFTHTVSFILHSLPIYVDTSKVILGNSH